MSPIKSAIVPRKRKIRQSRLRGEKSTIFDSTKARVRYKKTVISLRGKAKILAMKNRRTGLWQRKRKKRRPTWRTRY